MKTKLFAFFIGLFFVFSFVNAQSQRFHEVNMGNRIVMETNVGSSIIMTLYMADPGLNIVEGDSVFFWIIQGNDTMEIGIQYLGLELSTILWQDTIDCISDTLTIIGDVGQLHIGPRGESDLRSLTIKNHTALTLLWVNGASLQSLTIENCLKLYNLFVVACPHLNEVLLCGELPRLRFYTLQSCPSLRHIELPNYSSIIYISLLYSNIHSLDISPVTSTIQRIVLNGSQFSSCSLDDLFRQLPISDSVGSCVAFCDNPGTYGCRDHIALEKGWSITKTGLVPVNEEEPNINFSCMCDEPNRPDFSKEIDLSVESGKWFDLSYSADNTAVWVVNGSDTLVKRSTERNTCFGFRTQIDTVKVFGKCSTLDVSHNGSTLTHVGSPGHTILHTLSVADNSIDLIDLRCFPNLVSADLQRNRLDRILLDSTSSLRNLSLQGNRLNDCFLDTLFTRLPHLSNGNDAGVLTVAQDGFGNPGIYGCRTYEANDRGWNVYANGSALHNTEFGCEENFPVPNYHNRLDFSVSPNTNIHCVFRFSEHGTLQIINGIDTSLLNFSSGQQKEADLVTTGAKLSFIGNLSYLNMTADRRNRNIKAMNIMEHDCLEELYVYDVGLNRVSINHCDKLKKSDVAKNNINHLFIEDCPELEVLFCYKNALTACELDTLYHKLPIRTDRSAGKIYVEDNPEYAYSRDTIAYNKNWHVIGPNNTPIHNDDYTCPYFTIGLNAPVSESLLVEIFPNPVKGWVYITSGEDMETLEIFNLFGQKVFSAAPGSKHYSLDTSIFPAGCYIVKVLSEARWSVCRILIK